VTVSTRDQLAKNHIYKNKKLPYATNT